MLTDDFIIEQSMMVIRFLKTALISPGGGFIEEVEDIPFQSPQLEIKKELESLIKQKEYCQAEDLLYEQLEQEESDDNLCLGLWFYNRLLDEDEETMEEHNFGKDEILAGLKELESKKIDF